MSHVEISSRVGADGVLRIAVPFGPGEANREVKVIVEPAAAGAPPTGSSQEEWRAFVKNMAGCISDPTFRRAEYGVHG
jgi:hypothetical protein